MPQCGYLRSDFCADFIITASPPSTRCSLLERDVRERMSNELNPRRGSTNLHPAEVAAIENEQLAFLSALDVRPSLESSGYPSWLPRRPQPPAPASSTNTGAGSPVAGGDFRSSADDLAPVSPDNAALSPTTPSRPAS